MIIHKEQVDCMLPSGEAGKALYVSYVDKDGSIKKMYYPIPKEQMFNWKYCGMPHMLTPIGRVTTISPSGGFALRYFPSTG